MKELDNREKYPRDEKTGGFFRNILEVVIARDNGLDAVLAYREQQENNTKNRGE